MPELFERCLNRRAADSSIDALNVATTSATAQAELSRR